MGRREDLYGWYLFVFNKLLIGFRFVGYDFLMELGFIVFGVGRWEIGLRVEGNFGNFL